MCKGSIAEWILSLATTRDRATSTAGDLLEEAAFRGVCWFWVSLLRATISLVWQAWVNDPVRMAGLALGACFFELAFMLVAGGLVLLGGMAIQGTVQMLWGNVFGLTIHSYTAAAAVLWVATSIWQFFVGGWLGRHSPGRELAACLAYLVVERVLNMTLVLFVPLSAVHYTSLDVTLAVAAYVVSTMLVVAGAARVRAESAPVVR
jgi:hypothetical protein